MRQHKKGFSLFVPMLMVSLLACAAFISGGCGGSTTGVGNQVTTTDRRVLIGDLTQARFDGSDLTSYVSKRITETVNLSDADEMAETLTSLTKGDFLFIGNAGEVHSDLSLREELEFLSALVGGITTAYENGAAIVLVYPNSKDVAALNSMLSLALAHPYEEAPVKAFELLGVANRQLPDESYHVFTYGTHSYGNAEYFESLANAGTSQNESNQSADVEQITEEMIRERYSDLPTVTPIDKDEMKNALCEKRVQGLFDWYEGLDSRLEGVAASVRSAVDDFVQKTDTNTELLSIATGVTSDWDDDYSVSFSEFQEKYLKGTHVGNLFELIEHAFGDASQTFDNVTVKRNTHTHAQVVSLHSFDTHKDYYLVLSEPVTQPKSIWNNGGDIIIGFTKALYTNIWPSMSGTDHLEKYWPSTVVNNSTTYSATDSWEAGSSVTCGSSVGSSLGANGNGFSGSINSSVSVSCTYSEKVSHSSQKTWTTHDYEIIPEPQTFDSNGQTYREAYWKNSISWPDSDGTSLSVAAGTTINLQTEAIFSVPAEQSDSFKLYERTDVGEAAQIFGAQQSGVVCGQVYQLNMIRPLHLAFTNKTQSGPKEKRQYLAAFNCEGDWTAESDVSWLTMLDPDGNPGQTTSGGAGTNNLFFEVDTNSTGHQRKGKLTIKSGEDSIFITFNQAS